MLRYEIWLIRLENGEYCIKKYGSNAIGPHGQCDSGTVLITGCLPRSSLVSVLLCVRPIYTQTIQVEFRKVTSLHKLPMYVMVGRFDFEGSRREP